MSHTSPILKKSFSGMGTAAGFIPNGRPARSWKSKWLHTWLKKFGLLTASRPTKGRRGVQVCPMLPAPQTLVNAIVKSGVGSVQEGFRVRPSDYSFVEAQANA